MKRYNLVYGTVEIKYDDRDAIKPGCTLERDSSELPQLVKTFEDKNAAIEELRKHKSSVRVGLQNQGTGDYLVAEYHVHEIEVDENGDFVGDGDFLEFSEMPERTEWE